MNKIAQHIEIKIKIFSLFFKRNSNIPFSVFDMLHKHLHLFKRKEKNEHNKKTALDFALLLGNNAPYDRNCI